MHDCDTAFDENDQVHSPNHYCNNGMECIEAIEGMIGSEFPAYCKGNVLKYLWRAGKKGDLIEDLEKAKVYIDFMIDHEKEKRNRSGLDYAQLYMH